MRQTRSPVSEAVSTHKVCVRDFAAPPLQGIKPSAVPRLGKICLCESIWQFQVAIVLLWSVTFNAITCCFNPDQQLWHGATGVQLAQRLVGSNKLRELALLLGSCQGMQPSSFFWEVRLGVLAVRWSLVYHYLISYIFSTEHKQIFRYLHRNILVNIISGS